MVGAVQDSGTEMLDGVPAVNPVTAPGAITVTTVPLQAGKVEGMIDARENAGLAALTAAILNGASIVRVHSVRPAVEAARIADAIRAAR